MESNAFDNQMVEKIKQTHSFETGVNSISRMAYHTGKHDIKDPYLLDILVNNMEIYKEQFSSRQSFGVLYAALRTSYDKHVIYFFKHEYQKFDTYFTQTNYSDLIRLQWDFGSYNGDGLQPQLDDGGEARDDCRHVWAENSQILEEII